MGFLSNCQDAFSQLTLPVGAEPALVKVSAKLSQCHLPPPPAPPRSVGSVPIENEVTIIDDFTDIAECARLSKLRAASPVSNESPERSLWRQPRLKWLFSPDPSVDDADACSVTADIEVDEDACELLLGDFDEFCKEWSPSSQMSKWCRSHADDIDGISEPDDVPCEYAVLRTHSRTITETLQEPLLKVRLSVDIGSLESGEEEQARHDTTTWEHFPSTSAVAAAEAAATLLGSSVEPFDDGHVTPPMRWCSKEESRTVVDAQLNRSLDRFFGDEQIWDDIAWEIGKNDPKLRSSMNWLRNSASSHPRKLLSGQRQELSLEVDNQLTNSLDKLFENKQLWQEVPWEISKHDSKLQSSMEWLKMVQHSKSRFRINSPTEILSRDTLMSNEDETQALSSVDMNSISTSVSSSDLEESDRSSGFLTLRCHRTKIVNDRYPITRPKYRNIPNFDEERVTAQFYSKRINPFGDTPPSSLSPEDSPVATPRSWIR